MTRDSALKSGKTEEEIETCFLAETEFYIFGYGSLMIDESGLRSALGVQGLSGWGCIGNRPPQQGSAGGR
jgi:hypothetical protein